MSATRNCVHLVLTALSYSVRTRFTLVLGAIKVGLGAISGFAQGTRDSFEPLLMVYLGLLGPG
jgi:hypothetical protein